MLHSANFVVVENIDATVGELFAHLIEEHVGCLTDLARRVWSARMRGSSPLMNSQTALKFIVAHLPRLPRTSPPPVLRKPSLGGSERRHVAGHVLATIVKDLAALALDREIGER
jgi:hypothetical protein